MENKQDTGHEASSKIDVIERERQFHNNRFSQDIDPRAHLDKWYASVRHGAERQDMMVLDLGKNKKVLEYGCSDGGLSLQQLKLPMTCESFTGIDISDVAIAKATEHAASLGYKNTRFVAMNAEAMSFPDDSFDLVFGRGIVHHLDLNKCFGEVSRVLTKNGIAVFCEPMGHNPLLNLYRNKTPDIRTADEHPLLMADFDLARHYFSQVDTIFFGFLSVASVCLDSSAKGIAYRVSKAIDDYILQFPIIGRYAWHCLMVCKK